MKLTIVITCFIFIMPTGKFLLPVIKTKMCVISRVMVRDYSETFGILHI